MSWKNWGTGAALLAMLATAPVTSAMAAEEQNVKTLVEVFTQIVDSHYSQPDEDKILAGAIRGMLETLGDPHTNYMTPKEYTDFVGGINQAYAGIGVSLQHADDGSLLVSNAYAGSPAAEAGLQKGDRIVQVDDLIVTRDNRDTAVTRMRGPADSQVTVQFVRGGERLTRTLTRKEIQLPTVVSHRMENGIGYIGIYSFGEGTSYEVKKELTQLERAGVKGLIVDVRGNGGGYVVSALAIADLFLSEGILLYAHDENGEQMALEADADASSLPLTVLVDGYSASASEILAGALQKAGRAKLVGEQTYGKGTMQSPSELPNGGYLKVSVDRWEFRDGTNNDQVGLTPDVRLSRSEAFLNAAEQLLLPDRRQLLLFDRQTGAAMVNGYELTDAPALVREDGRLYLPLRYTMESLGAQVNWLPATGEVAFELDGRSVRLHAGSGSLTVDGRPVTAEQPVLSVYGSTYLSADAMQAITGLPVLVTDKHVSVESN